MGEQMKKYLALAFVGGKPVGKYIARNGQNPLAHWDSRLGLINLDPEPSPYSLAYRVLAVSKENTAYLLRRAVE